MNVRLKAILVHGGLFIATLITTTLGGLELIYGKTVFNPQFSPANGFSHFFNPQFSLADFVSGFAYSVSFLGILTVHEFGHYFTAMYHRIKASLPYYIPMPWFFFQLGTMGAIIRIRGVVRSKQQHFDIGIAGPLAGFVVAMGVLWYGFTHLPPPEYIFQIHPEYSKYGLDYASHVYRPEVMPPGIDISVGKNLIVRFFEAFVADPARLPNPHEVIHYPFLLAGFLSLVFTSINLLPIGQLDGGHVLYGLVGYRRHRIVATIIYLGFLFYATKGIISPAEPVDELIWKIPLMVLFLYQCLTGLKWRSADTLLTAVIIFTTEYVLKMIFPSVEASWAWVPFAFIIGRFIGVPHPPSEIETPLSRGRIILGWFALMIFVLCFVPNPFY